MRLNLATLLLIHHADGFIGRPTTKNYRRLEELQQPRPLSQLQALDYSGLESKLSTSSGTDSSPPTPLPMPKVQIQEMKMPELPDVKMPEIPDMKMPEMDIDMSDFNALDALSGMLGLSSSEFLEYAPWGVAVVAAFVAVAQYDSGYEEGKSRLVEDIVEGRVKADEVRRVSGDALIIIWLVYGGRGCC